MRGTMEEQIVATPNNYNLSTTSKTRFWGQPPELEFRIVCENWCSSFRANDLLFSLSLRQTLVCYQGKGRAIGPQFILMPLCIFCSCCFRGFSIWRVNMLEIKWFYFFPVLPPLCTVYYSHHPFVFAILSSVQSPNSQARFQSEHAFSLLPDFI